MNKILCIDFDGVIHAYTSGWEASDVIKDGPVEGALDWLRSLIKSEEFKPCIYSSRSKDTMGREAMKIWLKKHGLEQELIDRIDFPITKPPAWLTIDDRAFHFQGTFPTEQAMSDFKPWNKQ